MLMAPCRRGRLMYRPSRELGTRAPHATSMHSSLTHTRKEVATVRHRLRAVTDDWQTVLRTAVRDPLELCRLLNLDPALMPVASVPSGVPHPFPMLVPRPYLERIVPGNPRDPLLLQVWPAAAEGKQTPGFHCDPVGDGAARLAPGLLHKYHGRALLIATGACAVHCRYCFRRHYPYTAEPHGLAAWAPALAAIRRDSTIQEVLLSGGDPLTLVDAQLAALVGELAQIEHVRRLRVHTRLPIVIPQRVTDGLLAWLTGTRLRPWVVVHVNHARELDAATRAALRRLIDAGVPVLNQAVLLSGVNDSVPALEALCLALVDLGVQPYYLHQLDRVAGAAHFEVPLETGRKLVDELRRRLPGYALPRYVQEQAGEPSKTPL